MPGWLSGNFSSGEHKIFKEHKCPTGAKRVTYKQWIIHPNWQPMRQVGYYQTNGWEKIEWTMLA